MLTAEDREHVEALVAAMEDVGAEIERVRADRSFDDDPIEFRIRGILPEDDEDD